MQKNGEATERRGSMVKCKMENTLPGPSENSVGLSMYEDHIETVEYIWMNIEKLQEFTPSA